MGDNLEDIENQYNEWFCVMVEDGNLFEEDRFMF